MGKKRRLNKFISKWIKSDLPEDRSTVLLLGVTRIPTSPVPARRPCSLPLVPNNSLNLTAPDHQHQLQRRSSSASRRSIVRRNSSKRRQVLLQQSSSEDDSTAAVTTPPPHPPDRCPDSGESPVTIADDDGLDSAGSVTPSNCVSYDSSSAPVMERSVDSIGTCSLDVEASADLSDWSEVSSVGTLRSASILTPPPEPHLPSYLSLACTVNGYSTTTNYDPVRLARSRDASPHRIESDNLIPRNVPTYSVQNNLLSPPNLVPLPSHLKLRSPKKMADNTLAQHHHQEFYSSSKTMTYLTKESHFTSNIYAKDSIDACLDNGHYNIQNKCVSYESKNITSINGQTKCTTESSVRQEFTNGSETKSFIQQRVERLYGPGALAQGFFVTKRQKHNSSLEHDKSNCTDTNDNDKHSKSLTDKLLDVDENEPIMKQSTSSPTLPVMRHLRPEFRAQLPTISPRKGVESLMQKSSTVPTLKNEVKVNGHSSHNGEVSKVLSASDTVIPTVKEDSGEKNGHYFLKILEEQNKRLLECADKTEQELSNPDLSEEIIGKVRSAAGKARLLVSQKMQQFKGLCTNNINQSEGEAFPTTNEDLQGFWDMVMLQVDQVDALFNEINVLKNNNWKEVKPVDTVDTKTNGSVNNRTRKVVNRPRPNTAVNDEARKQREAQRKAMIEERRKAMRAQNSKPKESIEIFVPESS